MVMRQLPKLDTAGSSPVILFANKLMVKHE